MKPAAANQNSKSDGLLRLVSVAFRRYSRDPDTRTDAARLLVLSAIALYADETSAGEAALLTSEGIALLAVQERQRGSR